MPFPKNPKSLPRLHFGFLDLISKSNLLINHLAAITGGGKTVQSSPTWHWHQQKLQAPSSAFKQDAVSSVIAMVYREVTSELLSNLKKRDLEHMLLPLLQVHQEREIQDTEGGINI